MLRTAGLQQRQIVGHRAPVRPARQVGRHVAHRRVAAADEAAIALDDAGACDRPVGAALHRQCAQCGPQLRRRCRAAAGAARGAWRASDRPASPRSGSRRGAVRCERTHRTVRGVGDLRDQRYRMLAPGLVEGDVPAPAPVLHHRRIGIGRHLPQPGLVLGRQSAERDPSVRMGIAVGDPHRGGRRLVVAQVAIGEPLRRALDDGQQHSARTIRARRDTRRHCGFTVSAGRWSGLP
jgi:hypothetical protein